MRLNNNKPLFWTALSIVFAFNIAVVGTLAYFFITHRIVFENVRHEELRENFREIKGLRPEIHTKYHDNIKPLNDINKKLRIQFLGELIKENPDYDSLLVLSKKIQDNTQKISMNFYKEMVEIRKTLSPEDAEKFFGHQLKMMERKFMPPHADERMGMPPEDPERGPRDWNGRDQRLNRRKNKIN